MRNKIPWKKYLLRAAIILPVVLVPRNYRIVWEVVPGKENTTGRETL